MDQNEKTFYIEIKRNFLWTKQLILNIMKRKTNKQSTSKTFLPPKFSNSQKRCGEKSIILEFCCVIWLHHFLYK